MPGGGGWNWPGGIEGKPLLCCWGAAVQPYKFIISVIDVTNLK
jgi:hypothetical protein